MEKKKKVLFLCTHNAARSQIAEGLMNSLLSEKYEAHSAGIEPTSVHPFAVTVMSEIGIDISHNRSKSVDEFFNEDNSGIFLFDYVVTVCEHAKEACPYFPNAQKRLHQSFTDPASLDGADASKLEAFRKIRDEITEWLLRVFGEG